MSAAVNVAGDLISVVVFQRVTPRCVLLAPGMLSGQRDEA